MRLGEELIEPREFERTEFCADWCKQVGIYHMIGGTAPIRDGLAVAVGVHRPQNTRGFTETDKRVFALLMTNVVRACQLADKIGTLERRVALSFDILSDLKVGLLILDARGRLLHLNAVAQRLMRSSRWITYAGGVVRPIHPADANSFAQRVADAADPAGSPFHKTQGAMTLQDPVDGKLAVTITPFRSQGMDLGIAEPAVAVVFGDPDGVSRIQLDEISRVLSLTAAEARLAAIIASGHSLVEAAKALGISANTAKTQLKSIFAKTGCQRQADLVALVIGHPLLRLGHEQSPK